MESSDDDTLSERSCVSEPSFRTERSGGSLSPCTSGLVGPPGDTLPWNLSKHERRKRKSQDSVLDPAERAVVRVADERDRVQKKTFTKWVNKHLIKVIYPELIRDAQQFLARAQDGSLLENSGELHDREQLKAGQRRIVWTQEALEDLRTSQTFQNSVLVLGGAAVGAVWSVWTSESIMIRFYR
ncbi:microtubule-actin cross-linking factor 1-like [Cyprinodon tularosa]|uniref:microtubule-actin cross-linking factor 1-like n=1 Tax=Cyprinodon tularosa TaxID=77115 RepID=UPI0018E1E6D6|nr:microtubule-actin cross-linking factor 1-like [Cyprinodon tularosa]